MTGLPGNIAIEQEIKSRLTSHKPFSIIYADLNQFKGFNDTYGFQHGDLIIRVLGELLVDESREIDEHSFIGHVGGDDFIVLSSASEAKILGDHLLTRFQARIEAVRGAKDLSLALAGLVIDPDTDWTSSKISEELAYLKKQAKLPKENNFILNNGSH